MSEQRWRPRIVDIVALLGFCLLWLLPVGYVGVRGVAPERWPITLRDLYSVSCLFGRASERVSVFYVQVHREGEMGWEDFDESEHFRLEPFGHRNRLNRFMARIGYRPAGVPARREFAQWLAKADRERHPDRAPIVAVRFLWGDHNITADRPPQGRWRKPMRLEVRPLRQLGKVIYVGEQQAKERKR